MPRYGSRELVELLDIKPHVLRYWEQQLPLIRSDRDETGHRVWTSAHVRLLRRLHHLIVGRGMSVQAAGETLLREGETTPANVKAGLEAVREELLATLHGIRNRDVVGNRTNVAATAKESCFEEPLSETQELPVSMISPLSPDTSRSLSPRALLYRRNRTELPKPSDRPIVPVVYRHLFAYAASGGGTSVVPDPVPPLLCRILAHRLPDSANPVVVCVPPDALQAYRNAFQKCPDLFRRVLFLEIPRFEYRGKRWFSPTLGAIYTLVSPATVQTLPSLHSSCRFYFWAADSPDSPPPQEVAGLNIARSGMEESVVTLMLHESDDASIIGESFVLDIPDGYAHVTPRKISPFVLRGRWSIGGVIPERFDRNASNADITQEGWRYDLWVRDMASPASPWVSIPRSSRPTLWRGYDWRIQIPVVWPEIT